MNFGKIAIGLWVLTVMVFAYFFVKGSTRESTDHRLAVQLSPEETDLVLGEMRSILGAVDGILKGVAANDLPAVASAARTAGMAMAVDLSPVFMAKLPLAFKAMGMSLHQDFDKLAADVDGGLGKDEVVGRLSDMTSKCVSCHQSYRLSATGS